MSSRGRNPLPDQSVDVVISNGMINLSPRKSRVLAELYRGLRPGGRFTVTDLILEEELLQELTTSDVAWVVGPLNWRRGDGACLRQKADQGPGSTTSRFMYTPPMASTRWPSIPSSQRS